MKDIILNTIYSNHLFEKGDAVIVALSGGADSMALFHFLQTHQHEIGITVSAAHFDHGLRGEESLQDACFVEGFCTNSGVLFYTEKAHMQVKDKPAGISIEEWARTLRYDFFAALAKRHSAKIALAHTLSDNAETVLFHAVRGTGPRGISGIPVKRGCFVRPFLGISRKQVEQYCAKNQIPFVTDSTNTDCFYARNRIRHKVLPELEKVHAGAAQALARLAKDMREIDCYLAAQAQQVVQAAQKEEGLDICALQAAAPPLLMQILAGLAGPSVTRKQLHLMEQVVKGNVRAVQISDGRTVTVRQGCLVLSKEKLVDEAVQYEIPFTTGKIPLPDGQILEVSRQEIVPELSKIKLSPSKDLKFVADYDKIARCNAIFRNRRPGDTFAPQGRGCTKPLKKWLNEEKIPPEERPLLPLLAHGNKVLWVKGGGFCNGVQPNAATRAILTIHVT